MHDGSTRAILAAFLANLGIAVAKLIGFFFTGAASMLAEAIHSVADTGNQGLLFLGGVRSRRPENDIHPFGHSRARYFWAFVVAMVLFSLGGLFALWEGWQKLIHPQPVESPEIALAILSVAIILESVSFRTAVREANRVRGDRSWWQFIQKAKGPELPVVLLEDLGALIGLGIALVGVTLAIVFAEPRFDALGSVGIGLLLVLIALLLAVEMKSLLLGEAADPQVEGTIRRIIEEHDSVCRVIHMRTEHLGPDDLLVGAKVEFRSEMSVRQLVEVINDVEAAIRTRVPMAHRIYLEPDEFRRSGTGEG